MKQSQHLLDNAITCSKLAKRSTDKQIKTRFKRIENAWRSLAREQDWLDGDYSNRVIEAELPHRYQTTPIRTLDLNIVWLAPSSARYLINTSPRATTN